MAAWNPHSWQGFPALQQPEYPDPSALEAALARLRRLPPLVSADEVDRLRRLLAEAAAGRRFLLQGGDCAEQFKDCQPEAIADKLRVLLQMSVVLTHSGRRPVVRVGRIAGQYAKPRSSPVEKVRGRELPSYRGDLVNGLEPTAEARRPDPERMVQAYFHSGATLNYIRGLIDGGFADLHHPERWELPRQSHRAYRAILDQVRESLEFLSTLGNLERGALERIDFFTSHEALLLPYEEALTRWVADGQAHYNLGAHMLWAGDRTRGKGGAHREYLRGIANPVGIKLGPTTDPEELPALLEELDPAHVPGRITLVTRLGAERVRELLPPVIRAVRRSGRVVLWCCDPMHGNGIEASVLGLSPEQEAEGHRANGAAQGATRRTRVVKTRRFDAIQSELRQCFEIHREEGSQLGGVHFEMTGEDVTECIGGVEGLSEADLPRAYETGCDPRLNGTQGLEMAFLIAQMLQEPPRGERLLG